MSTGTMETINDATRLFLFFILLLRLGRVNANVSLEYTAICSPHWLIFHWFAVWMLHLV